MAMLMDRPMLLYVVVILYSVNPERSMCALGHIKCVYGGMNMSSDWL